MTGFFQNYYPYVVEISKAIFLGHNPPCALMVRLDLGSSSIILPLSSHYYHTMMMMMMMMMTSMEDHHNPYDVALSTRGYQSV